jgi:hypothetical protein
MAESTTSDVKYSATSMKARLGLNATAKIKSPSGIVKPVAPVTPSQFHRQAADMAMLNDATALAGEAMRQREVNYGVGGLGEPEGTPETPTATDAAKDRIAKQSKGQTKQSIFGG